MTELPTTFGKYFLTEKLAIGGMAEIYLGKLLGPGGFEKPIVIKKIHPTLSGQRHFVDLFVAEAKTLVTLAHGNIVPVYELGVIDDTYFIAMEYIDGPTLYRLTEAVARRDERLDPAVAAWIAARILEGLDYAHRKGDGVIHRDLSPRNVMLSRDGEVKLVDFGIAVALGESDGHADAQAVPTGSFPYMSPEQVRREPLDGQSDLFSVGVLLWEMLAGRRLFARADADATLRAVTHAAIPRPLELAPAVPARLDEVTMRALARDRGQRWPAASAMLQELQRYLYSLDETPGPRTLAALVARYCPPETRRLPTHADPAPPEAVGDSDAAAAPAAPAGPRTARIDRRGAPAGKRRARTETFATHVQLSHFLERSPGDRAADPAALAPDPPASRRGDDDATASAGPPDGDGAAAPAPPRPPRSTEAAPPLAPLTAPAAAPTAAAPARPPAARADAPAADPPAPAPRAAAAPTAAAPTAAAPTAAAPTAAGGAAPARPPAGRADAPAVDPPAPAPRAAAAPSPRLVAALAAGTLIAGGAAVAVFLRGRDRLAGPADAPGGSAAGAAAPDARAPLVPRDPAAAAPDAAAPDAPARDASSPLAPPPDAPPPIPDAPRRGPGGGPRAPGPRPPDAAPLPRDAAIPRPPAADATLIVGANPWGEVFIDGVRRGRTPATLVVPAGKRVVEVVFGGEDPPRTQRFAIDLRPGSTQQLDADFTRP